MSDLKHVIVFTDGSCSGNPGPGGWAAILQYNHRELVIGGNAADTTNNRMELQAVIAALEALKFPCAVSINTDSAYIANTGNGGWIRKWKQAGWKTASNKPVANKDLWERIAQLSQIHEVRFQKVIGHAGNYFNERADTEARAMCDSAKSGKITHHIVLAQPNKG